MGDREPKYQAPPGNFLITDTIQRFFDRSSNIINALQTESPELADMLAHHTQTIEAVNLPTSPAMPHAVLALDAMMMNRARAGLEGSVEIRVELGRRIQESARLESQYTMIESLRSIAECDSTDEHELKKAFFRLKDNPGRAIRYSKQTLDLIAEQLDTDDELDLLDSQLMSAYHATLLSGDPSAYKRFNRICHEQVAKLGQKYPIISTIANCTREPEKLAEILSNPSPEVSEGLLPYNNVRLLTTLMAVTDLQLVGPNVSAYRFAMIDFAKDVAFNPSYYEQFKHAFNDSSTDQAPSTPQPEALRQAIDMDWEPLPERELDEHARAIVSSKAQSSNREYTPPTVDLDRLEILRRIREYWGTDRSEYRRGVRDTRQRKAQFENGEEYFDEYIILVLMHFDENGNVIKEDAVADSPIAGRNALYVQRKDVNGWDWDELFRHKKDNVKSMGARDLRHVAPAGRDLVDDMTEKVIDLLTCSEEEFLEGRFDRDTAGVPRLRIPRRVMDIIIQGATEVT